MFSDLIGDEAVAAEEPSSIVRVEFLDFGAAGIEVHVKEFTPYGFHGQFSGTTDPGQSMA